MEITGPLPSLCAEITALWNYFYSSLSSRVVSQIISQIESFLRDRGDHGADSERISAKFYGSGADAD